MVQKKIPETIENRWDIFYSDFPEIYDIWAKIPKSPTAVEVIQQHFPMQGKTVVDIGSGTGLSSFELALYASRVIGIEPEAAMRAVAEQKAREHGVQNVTFLRGQAEAIPLPDHSVNMATAITLASLYNEENITAFAREAERVVQPGGVVLAVDTPSGWYGGELSEVILGKSQDELEETAQEIFFPRLGYARMDFDTLQDYGSAEHAVRTYGFIFGKHAINHIRAHNISVIRWRFSIHFRKVESYCR